MVNVRAIANRYTSTVNPNLTVQLYKYAGFTVNAAGKSVPSYAAPVPVVAQIQGLTKPDVKHLDSMNISGAERAAFTNLQLSAVDRVTHTGGDVLVFEGAPWLVTAVLQNWTTAGWGKVALTRQMVRAGEFGF